MQAPKDRLASARANRVVDFTVGGTTLSLHKWTLNQTFKHSAQMVDLLKLAVKDTRGNALKTMLEQDALVLLTTYYEKIRDVLADTVLTGNFENLADATAWINELSTEDCVCLLQRCYEDNLRPLANRLGMALPETASAKSVGAPKVQTSSPNSSQEVTPLVTCGTPTLEKSSSSTGPL